MEAIREKTCPTPVMCRLRGRPDERCIVHDLPPEILDCEKAGHTPDLVIADNGFTYIRICTRCGEPLD